MIAIPGNSSDLVTPIIRSSSERTSRISQALVEREFPGCEVHFIEERPFSKTLRRTFELGLEVGKKWTLCIDADVLIKTGALRRVLSYAEDIRDDSMFELQGCVLDRLFVTRRPAGNHCYRTAMLTKAMRFIPNEGVSLRPESDTIGSMAKRGCRWIQLDQVVGIHDYEQYYKDIYKKAFLQARKFCKFRESILERWDQLAKTDLDYRVARFGWMDSERCSRDVYADNVTEHEGRVTEILYQLGVTEKLPLSFHSWDLDYAARVIEQFKPGDSCLWEKELTPECNVPLGSKNDVGKLIRRIPRRVVSSLRRVQLPRIWARLKK